MDIWNATHFQIGLAAEKYYGKYPTEILKQSGLFAYVYFADGTNKTVYGWML